MARLGYKYIEGATKTHLTISEAYEVGKMVAIYHNIVGASNLDNGKRQNSKDAATDAINSLKLQGGNALKNNDTRTDRVFLKSSKTLIRLSRKLQLSEYYGFRTYPLHMDITPVNIVWEKGRITGLLDFENVSFIKTTFLMDLVQPLLYCSVNPKTNGKLDIGPLKAILKGYGKYRKLTFNDINLIPSLLILTEANDLEFLYWKLKTGPKHLRPSHMTADAVLANWIWNNKGKLISDIVTI